MLSAMSRDAALPRVTWLGGRTFTVEEFDNPIIPYRYLMMAEDGTERLYVHRGSTTEGEVEALLKGVT